MANKEAPRIGLLDLPAELQCNIASHCTDHDIIALRQVCREISGNCLDTFRERFFKARAHLFTLDGLRLLQDITSRYHIVAKIRSIELIPLHFRGVNKIEGLLRREKTAGAWDEVEQQQAFEAGSDDEYEPRSDEVQSDDWDGEVAQQDEDMDEEEGEFNSWDDPMDEGNAAFLNRSIDDDEEEENADSIITDPSDAADVEAEVDTDDDREEEDIDDYDDLRAEYQTQVMLNQHHRRVQLAEARGRWLEDQQILHDNGLAVEILAKILENLAKAGARPTFSFGPKEKLEQCHGLSQLYDLLGRRVVDRFVEAYAYANPVIACLNTASAMGRGHIAGLKLSTFDLAELHKEAFEIPQNPIQPPWFQLTSLEISLWTFNPASYPEAIDALGSALSSAINLEVLHVYLPNSLDGNDTRALQLLSDKVTTAPLRDLRLRYFNGPKELLLDFVLRFHKTLRVLELHQMGLPEPEDWSDVINTLARELNRLDFTYLGLVMVPNTVKPTHWLLDSDGNNVWTFIGKDDFVKDLQDLVGDGGFVEMPKAEEDEEEEEQDDDDDDDGAGGNGAAAPVPAPMISTVPVNQATDADEDDEDDNKDEDIEEIADDEEASDGSLFGGDFEE